MRIRTCNGPRRRTTTKVLAAAALALLGPGGPAAAAEVAPGLPSIGSGHRPGPDALYLPPPRAPQLENTGPWQADPILVSGTEAYRDGEWVYQDFLFDDHGATGVPTPRGDPYGTSTNLYSPSAGTFLYPTDPVYAHNAADLVELRVRPLDDATAFRVTLNTLLDPERTGFTIALGDGPAAEWPHGAGVSSPAGSFLTVHGTTAELLDAATGDAVTPPPAATVDLERRQIEVRVPHAAWDPDTGTVRLTIGVGLWDVDAGTYLAPQPGSAGETTPGGGDLRGTAIVNVGPRFHEPTPLMAGYTMGDTAAGAQVLAPWWRERQQSLQLSQGDVTPFAAEIDFAALAAGTRDDSGVPTSGPMDRILASRYVDGQGVRPENVCFGISAGIDVGTECFGRYVGQLQPYAVYVPDRQPPESGFGLTLLLHSLSANHNQYLGTNNQVQLGERGAGSVVITPEARGPDGFYKGIPEAHTFEVWADVARHHPVDPTWVTVSGYSMGGFGTYRLMARYPDLFARGFSVVGAPGSAEDQLISLRNTPVMAWNATADELVNVATAEEAHAALVDAGVDHRYWQFPQADHLTLAANDEYGPGADFLGEHRVDRDPATVSYVVDPREDSRDVVADHAYWLSELNVRDPEASPTGAIEVHSSGFGVASEEATELAPGGGVLTGGQNQAMPYVSRGVERTAGAAEPIADVLTITATNVAHVTIDARRARVSCDAELRVESDGPLDVDLVGCEAPAAADRPAAAPATLPTTGGGAALLGLGAVAGARVLTSGRRGPPRR
ncbi:MAG: dienelactone hydrolase family protein [Actinobacteria bacterium]|nr:dienelactone hydrolase family protein [Actinomycetota bacterium]